MSESKYPTTPPSPEMIIRMNAGYLKSRPRNPSPLREVESVAQAQPTPPSPQPALLTLDPALLDTAERILKEAAAKIEDHEITLPLDAAININKRKREVTLEDKVENNKRRCEHEEIETATATSNNRKREITIEEVDHKNTSDGGPSLNYRNTGSIPTFHLSPFIDDDNPRSRKTRKTNTGTPWYLSPHKDRWISTGFNYALYHKAGPSHERFKATKDAVMKRHRFFDRQPQRYTLNRQRPLVNTTRVNSGMFNVIDLAKGEECKAKYKLLKHPSLNATCRPTKLGSRIRKPKGKRDVRRASREMLEQWRLECEKLGKSQIETEYLLDRSVTLNSAVAVPEGTQSIDIIAGYDQTENLTTRIYEKRSNEEGISSHLSLRESVLIAQETHWTVPAFHGEKAALRLNAEFFCGTPKIGHLSSHHWNRSKAQDKEWKAWRAARMDEVTALKVSNEKRDVAIHAMGDDLRKLKENAEDQYYTDDQEEDLEQMLKEQEAREYDVLNMEGYLEMNETRMKDWKKIRDEKSKPKKKAMIRTVTKRNGDVLVIGAQEGQERKKDEKRKKGRKQHKRNKRNKAQHAALETMKQDALS